MPQPCTVSLDRLHAAAEPSGIVTTRWLREAGVPPSTIWRRCRPGGPWTPLLPGVVDLGTRAPTPHRRLLAAQLYGGPAAVVSGAAALRLHGLRVDHDDPSVLVLVPHGRHVGSRAGGPVPVVVERTTRLPAAWVREGVAVAPLTRAVLDAARRVHGRDAARALLAEAVQRGRTTPARLASELALGSGRGSAVVRSVLAGIEEGARSVAEGWAYETVVAAALPRPRWNVELYGPDGFLARPDAYWDEEGVAWEIDSREWHLRPEDWERTQRRRRDLEEAGVLVVSTLPRWLRDDRERVVRHVLEALARGALLPPPRVRVREKTPERRRGVGLPDDWAPHPSSR